ncbi:hypothetical protein BDQ12DRAFT_486484 [Crucibulum laeve]|uniref:Telomerase reverse transcriptase n=1 Tax=Crucibulum laeve TaxID=68775 RepID=A0A5C3M4H7_9AGAR|nr:hypothetical protein BDQ12DRAFT_486484 [Crucibulum laeve]
MARMGITNYFVNTIITALQAPEWESLLQRVGEDAMLHLLTDVSVFISLPNGSLCQMTGEPIIYLVPTMLSVAESSESQDVTSTTGQKRTIVDDDHGDARPAKRRKLNVKAGSINPPNNTLTSIQHPADIAFSRSKMFYARPNLIPHTNQIVVGLPLKHVLNRLVPSYRHNKEAQVQRHVEFDIRKQEENSRHVAKHIFARQYRLSNPFRVVFGKSTITSFPDYMDREVEIKAAGSCKTPKRLKEVLPLVEKLIWRHGKCGYKPLRNKVCPSKLRSTGSKDLDSSIILELMSERSAQFQSQAPQGTEDMSIDTSGNTITPFGLTQAERHAKMKPRFVEFTCSHIEVNEISSGLKHTRMNLYLRC